MITALALLMFTHVSASAAPDDDLRPGLQEWTCDGAKIKFRQGEDRLSLNGQDLAISWSDDGADGVFDDGEIEGGHHLQIFENGKVRLNDQPCTDDSVT